MKTVYDFTVKDRKGGEVSLSEYKGKVLLLIGTARDHVGGVVLGDTAVEL